MLRSLRKTTLFFGVLLTLLGMFAPSLHRICRAAAAGDMNSHPCCVGEAGCGPEYSSETCCKATHPSSRSPIPVPQVNPDTVKFFPALSLWSPSFQTRAGIWERYGLTLCAFPAPPSFLAHHAFLC